MLKLFVRILVFILALIYIGGRIGIVMTQMRNTNKGKVEYPTPKSNLPDSVWVAQTYTKTILCDTLGTVQVTLHLKDRRQGWMRAAHVREGEGPACQFTAGFNFTFEQDSIRIKYPLGALDGEARCPLKCRYTTYLRKKFSPTYQDTSIQGRSYQVLQFPDFKISER